MSEKLSWRKQCKKTCASLWWRFLFSQNVPSETLRVWKDKIYTHLSTFITAMFLRVYSALRKLKPRKHFHWSRVKLCTENMPLICCMNEEMIFGSYAALVEFHNLSRFSQLSLHWLILERSNASNVKDQDYTSEILQGEKYLPFVVNFHALVWQTIKWMAYRRT